MEDIKYNVALSFAGEDRPFVRQIADIFKLHGQSVFYDDFESSNMWGKELAYYLWNVYNNQSNYVIIFISKAYKEKVWTKHEFKSALNKALTTNEDYILPIRLDDTELPGLYPSIHFLDARKLTAQEICEAFLKKNGEKNNITNQLSPDIATYRFAHKKFAHEMSGSGARLKGGRWNQAGAALLYTCSTPALALIEILANAYTKEEMHQCQLMKIFIPGDIKFEMVYESSLEKGWKQDFDHTQEVGMKLIKDNKHCVISVPSAIVTTDRNYLINPLHNDFKKIKLLEVTDFEFDERLFKDNLNRF